MGGYCSTCVSCGAEGIRAPRSDGPVAVLLREQRERWYRDAQVASSVDNEALRVQLRYEAADLLLAESDLYITRSGMVAALRQLHPELMERFIVPFAVDDVSAVLEKLYYRVAHERVNAVIDAMITAAPGPTLVIVDPAADEVLWALVTTTPERLDRLSTGDIAAKVWF